MNHSTPGLPVHHQLPEFTQTHVHRVSDPIQPAHPLSSPSPPAPDPSQHQGLFQRVNSSHEKTIALTIWTFVGRVMSLLFNVLSRFVIAFLPRNNCYLIPWLQSLFTVILEPKKKKSVTTSTFPPSICHKVMRPDAIIFFFIFNPYHQWWRNWSWSVLWRPRRPPRTNT